MFPCIIEERNNLEHDWHPGGLSDHSYPGVDRGTSVIFRESYSITLCADEHFLIVRSLLLLQRLKSECILGRS